MPLDNIIHSTMYELVLEYKTSMHTMVLVIYEFVLSNTTACKLWIVLTLLVLLDSINVRARTKSVIYFISNRSPPTKSRARSLRIALRRSKTEVLSLNSEL